MSPLIRYRAGLAPAFAIVVSGVAGLCVVGRTASYYAETDPLAHSLVWAIGLVLIGGLAELGLRVRRCLVLGQAIDSLPSKPDADLLSRLSPTLRGALQARLERAPAPMAPAAFAPYLVGLLVMLGLLGTFLGLFDTLRGARDALTAGGDVEALRAGLTHPMSGLTRSFGSSAAGISASALLGFAAVFVRRLEGRTSTAMQTYAAGPLQALSPYRQQHEALLALAEQGRALPAAAEALGGVGTRLDTLAASWDAAHRESARAIEGALAGALDSARRDLERAAGQSAERLYALVTPLVTDAVEQVTAKVTRQLSGLVSELRAGHQAQRQSDAELRQVLLREVQQLAQGTHARVDALREGTSAQVAALNEGMTAQVEALLGGARSEVEALREGTETQIAGLREGHLEQLRALREGAAAFSSTLAQTARDLSNALVEVRTRDAAQIERSERALEGLEAAAQRLSAGLSEQRAQMEALIEGTGTQLTDLASAAAHGAASTLEALRNEAEAQAQRLATYMQGLTASHSQAANDLQERLEQHATRLTAGVSQAGSTVAEAADLLRASGAELSAVAEMFAASVESQRDAANAWLENLGELENAIEQAGRDAAADSLGEQLASTQEVFASQLQFQRELFEQLKDLRPQGSSHGHAEPHANA